MSPLLTRSATRTLIFVSLAVAACARSSRGCRRRTRASPPAASTASRTRMPSRYGSDCGLVTWPMTLTWLNALTGMRDDDVHLRRADVLGEHDFDVARELRGRLADRDHVLDQRRRDLAVGTHRHRGRQLGIAPHEDLQRVAGADDVVGTHDRRCGSGNGRSRGRSRDRSRLRRGAAGRQGLPRRRLGKAQVRGCEQRDQQNSLHEAPSLDRHKHAIGARKIGVSVAERIRRLRYARARQPGKSVT